MCSNAQGAVQCTMGVFFASTSFYNNTSSPGKRYVKPGDKL